MAPIRTPEGFVRVEKAPGIAAHLLDAADSVEGADRKTDVRSVTGAYHVSEEVYEKYVELFGDEDGVEQTDESDVTEEAAKAEREAAEAEAKRLADEQAAANADADEQPSEDWSHDKLNEYAGKLTPPLELTGSTPAKAEKLKLIAEHVEKNKA